MIRRVVGVWAVVLAGVLAFSGCLQEGGAVDDPLTISEAKSQTLGVEDRIVGLIPAEYVAEVVRQPQGVLLACDEEHVAWAGGLDVAMQSDPDFTQILEGIESDFGADARYTSTLETDTYGDPKLTLVDQHNGTWIIGPMKSGAVLSVLSFSQCFATPDGMQPSDTY